MCKFAKPPTPLQAAVLVVVHPATLATESVSPYPVAMCRDRGDARRYISRPKSKLFVLTYGRTPPSAYKKTCALR